MSSSPFAFAALFVLALGASRADAGAPAMGDASAGWAAVQVEIFCPENTVSFGGPPPVASVMGCRLADGETLHGPYQAWHADGSMAALGMFEDGVRKGEWTYWHANGQMAAYALYEGGAPDGGWFIWDEQGELLPESVVASAE